MLAYIFRRLLLIIPTLFGILLINFLIIQAAPGGPVEQMIAKLEGFDPASIRECIRGRRHTHGGFTWRLASGNPPEPGRYLVRYQWRNKMNGRDFDELVVTTWDGEKWLIFSGAQIVEWRHI